MLNQKLHSTKSNFAFIWVYEDDSGTFYSFSIKFADAATGGAFNKEYIRALWEHNNRDSFAKNVSGDDERYLIDNFVQDAIMTDAFDDDGEESDRDDKSRSGSDEDSEPETGATDKFASPRNAAAAEKNKALAVGYKHGRSFVLQGDKLNVFKMSNDDDGDVEFQTSLRIGKAGDKQFMTPNKMMLHQADRAMLFQDEKRQNVIQKMDLERGVIVEEWVSYIFPKGGKDEAG